MLLRANRFRIFTDMSKHVCSVVFDCFSKASWEVQTAVLKLPKPRVTFLKHPGECTQNFVRL